MPQNFDLLIQAKQNLLFRTFQKIELRSKKAMHLTNRNSNSIFTQWLIILASGLSIFSASAANPIKIELKNVKNPIVIFNQFGKPVLTFKKGILNIKVQVLQPISNDAIRNSVNKISVLYGPKILSNKYYITGKSYINKNFEYDPMPLAKAFSKKYRSVIRRACGKVILTDTNLWVQVKGSTIQGLSNTAQIQGRFKVKCARPYNRKGVQVVPKRMKFRTSPKKLIRKK